MQKTNEISLLTTPVFEVVQKEFDVNKKFKPVGLNCPDWVMIVPLDSRTDKTMIVKQTRWGIEDETTEWPCGTVELNERGIAAAIREFREETGIAVKEDDLEKVGEFNPNPAYFNNKMTVFVYRSKNLEKDFENRLEPELDSTEDCVVKLTTIKEATPKLFNNAMSLAAYALLVSKKYLKR